MASGGLCLRPMTSLLTLAVPSLPLQTLLLGSNALTGTLPPQFSSLASLRMLSLFDNKLHGTLPHELGSLPQARAMLRT